MSDWLPDQCSQSEFAVVCTINLSYFCSFRVAPRVKWRRSCGLKVVSASQWLDFTLDGNIWQIWQHFLPVQITFKGLTQTKKCWAGPQTQVGHFEAKYTTPRPAAQLGREQSWSPYNCILFGNVIKGHRGWTWSSIKKYATCSCLD